MTLTTILLQAAPEVARGGSQISSIIMMVAIIAVFYFFMIRPQAKKQKEIRKFRDSLAVGDQIVTAGGIYGKIRDIKDNVVTLEIAENVRIKVDKSSIYGTATDTKPEAK